MTDTYGGPYGGFSDVTNVIAAAAQTAVVAQVALLKALIPDITAGVSAGHPDFDLIPPEMAVKLRAEIDALSAAIDAAPTS